MNCPRCQAELLTDRDRDGVLVDLCPSCRGVWLDPGELEELVAVAAREAPPRRAFRPSCMDGSRLHPPLPLVFD